MQGCTHLLIGVGAGLIMKDKLDAWSIAMTCLGSLLPDLDHPKSMIGRRIPVASFFKMKHKGWTHSLIGLAIFSAIAAAINIVLAPKLALGYALHLVADSLTPAGVAWFYPFIKKKRHIIGICTGSLKAWGNHYQKSKIDK